MCVRIQVRLRTRTFTHTVRVLELKHEKGGGRVVRRWWVCLGAQDKRVTSFVLNAACDVVAEG